jgi:hypothetical protein
VVDRERPPSRSRSLPGQREAPRARAIRSLLCKNPLAVIPSEWLLMDNRGSEMCEHWVFFFAPRRPHLARAIARGVTDFLGLRPGNFSCAV